MPSSSWVGTTRLASVFRGNRKWLALLSLVFAAGGVYLATPQTSGHQPYSYSPLSSESFQPVHITTPTPVMTPEPTSSWTSQPTSTASPKPSKAPVTPKPTQKPRVYKHKATGTATWYNDGPGVYAAAGPALRVGNWRGRVVTVVRGNISLQVRLVDWCSCGNGRVIDLSPTAFRVFSPLSRGVMEVTVKW
jgi:rare lipoprotein A (peptidoglycan hydrolase)